MPSRELALFIRLIAKELRVLAASRSYWLLLLVVGALVGHAFLTSANLYAEASGIGGGPSALSQGLRPLEGVIVPTFGAYDLAATLLFPFVVIRLFALEKQTGELALTLQSPASLWVVVGAKGAALAIAWVLAGVAGLIALLEWRLMGGHLFGPEVSTVVLGHLLRGALTIGLGAAAGALAASAASAAIIVLTITLGTWALDYVAAARGGVIESVAAYTPSAALRVFEHGELRVSTILVLATIGIAGLFVAVAWMHEGDRMSRRAGGVIRAVLIAGIFCALFSQARGRVDASEDRRNSFSLADEAVLRSIDQPLEVTVYLAAEDPRLVDLERGVLAKLKRTLPDVRVKYAASGRTGLFERPDEHYGEVWYQIRDRRAMTRSATEEIVLETIYSVANRAPPTPSGEPAYSGYPLAKRATAAPWVFFVAWPAFVMMMWWWIRKPSIGNRDFAMSISFGRSR